LDLQKNQLTSQRDELQNMLLELKSTQTQLIQSEKMASLGELTAGIAHEIQNPLNFVNNFSEVNAEMIDELKEELKNGNNHSALSIAEDIGENEKKIRHHGKRADSIVKGMLEHSRAGSRQKEATDINALADEYLRLAYHGLRAKDKEFNADLKTYLDKGIPKINVIPQDIGRVLLNLFNNAFYAVNQKSKTSEAEYKPEVSVTTSAEKGNLVIKVKDNGNGIPDAIKDKIMQPFFTTKPTGEGTGLGLSLSYDIVVKGHGGSITVDTKEGEFTEFTVTLPIS
jgi:two-component system NtrC family sensor kinase